MPASPGDAEKKQDKKPTGKSDKKPSPRPSPSTPPTDKETSLGSGPTFFEVEGGRARGATILLRCVWVRCPVLRDFAEGRRGRQEAKRQVGQEATERFAAAFAASIAADRPAYRQGHGLDLKVWGYVEGDCFSFLGFS